MIIEFFGAPGAGKTTLAYALTQRLQENGHCVDLAFSFRPAEQLTSAKRRLWGMSGLPVAAVPRRLTRPVFELLTITRHPILISKDIKTAVNLLKTLPPARTAAAIRLGQYILRLSSVWHRASARRYITLFDQAFVQLICSLVLFHGSNDESLIAQALDVAPRPDLLVRLEAPSGMLAARLKERKRRQSAAERLLELNPDSNRKLIDIVDQLDRLLLDRGQLVIRGISADQRSLGESVDAIEAAVTARCGTAGKETAPTRLRGIDPPRMFAT
jgi:DNA polymerase III delta prime subunit